MEFRLKQFALILTLLPFFIGAKSAQLTGVQVYATFLDKENKEYTLPFVDTQIANFNDSLVRVAFKKDKAIVNVKGAMVFLNKKENEALYIPNFTGHQQLTKMIRGFTNNGKLNSGDMFELLQLEILGSNQKLPNVQKTF